MITSSGIYCITNPNGKIYIGSSLNIERRWYKYKRLDCKDQSAIYNSFIKYGVESHAFEVLEYCEVDKLIEREQMYLDFYCNPFPDNKLNICKIAGSTLGYIHTEESKKKISKVHKGKKLSEEHIDIIRKNMKGNKYSSITIIQYSKDGTFIAEYESAAEVKRQLGFDQSDLGKCCRNKKKSVGGYIWRYKEKQC